MKKLLWIFLVIISVLLFRYFQSPSVAENNAISILPTQQIQEKKVDFVIDFGSGAPATYSGVLALTAYDVLKNSPYEVVVKQYDFGIMVTSIKGMENTKERAWMYSVNGKHGETAADKYVLHEGDRIEWKFTKLN